MCLPRRFRFDEDDDSNEYVEQGRGLLRKEQVCLPRAAIVSRWGSQLQGNGSSSWCRCCHEFVHAALWCSVVFQNASSTSCLPLLTAASAYPPVQRGELKPARMHCRTMCSRGCRWARPLPLATTRRKQVAQKGAHCWARQGLRTAASALPRPTPPAGLPPLGAPRTAGCTGANSLHCFSPAFSPASCLDACPLVAGIGLPAHSASNAD